MYNVKEMLKNAFHFYKGRIAFHAILKAIGVSEGDEVIIPGFTCLGVALPVVCAGAKPVYADISAENYNIDVSKVESLITAKTKAIVAQHTYGIPVEMERLMGLAKKYNLYIIEDCCHTVASTYKGKPVGTYGHAAFYSYEWGKPIILGGGGSAISRDEFIKERLEKIYRSSTDSPMFDSMRLWVQRKAHATILRPYLFWKLRGLFRLLGRLSLVVQTFTKDEMSGQMVHVNQRMAAFLVKKLHARLQQIEASNKFRQDVANKYVEGLKKIGIAARKIENGTIYLRYPLQVKDRFNLLEEARKQNIEVGNWFYSPVHPLLEDELKMVHYKKGACPVAEAVSERIITLPIYNKVSQRHVKRTMNFLSEMKSKGYI